MADFEHFAREAGKALAASGRTIDIPSLAEITIRRRRTRLIQGASSMAILAIATVVISMTLPGSSWIGGPGAGSATPTTVARTEDGSLLFDPPRIVVDESVEFPLTMLDGRRISLTLPESIAADISGLVLGGAVGWDFGTCCGRSLDVSYGSLGDSHGQRQPDAEYHDAAGNSVGFFSDDDGPGYLVFQYGSWVVRAWDSNPEGERFTAEERARFASLMSGYETRDGFLILDPIEPMRVLPADTPDVALTDEAGQTLVRVFIWRECATEGPFAGSDAATSEGYLVAVSEASGTTSVCDPDDSLMASISQLGIPEVDLDAIRLTYQHGPPVAEGPTVTTPLSPTTTVEPSDDPTVVPIPLDTPVALQVLAVRPNDPSLAVIDLNNAKTTIYGPGAHALPTDATDGAASTPDGDWIIWTNGVARLFTEALDRVDVVLGPNPLRNISGFAPALRVVPTPDGRRAWLVQPGITYGSNDYPTLLQLATLHDGSPLLDLAVDGSAFPVGSTETGLILNVNRWRDTGDGFTIEPGSETVVQVTEDGTTIETGEGRAVAASPSKVIRVAAGRLLVSSPDGDDEIEVAKPFDGAWFDVGGPMVPSDAMPLLTISPDGTELLVSLGRDLDANQTPRYSELIAVNLASGATRSIAQFGGRTPYATWSSDGEWIALLWQKNITLINSTNPTVIQTLENVVPADHAPFAAG